MRQACPLRPLATDSCRPAGMVRGSALIHVVEERHAGHRAERRRTAAAAEPAGEGAGENNGVTTGAKIAWKTTVWTQESRCSRPPAMKSPVPATARSRRQNARPPRYRGAKLHQQAIPTALRTGIEVGATLFSCVTTLGRSSLGADLHDKRLRYRRPFRQGLAGCILPDDGRLQADRQRQGRGRGGHRCRHRYHRCARIRWGRLQCDLRLRRCLRWGTSP